MIVIMSAVWEEISGVKNSIKITRGLSIRGRKGYERRIWVGSFASQPVLLILAGMGKEKALDSAQYIRDHYPITALIFLGFAGALAPELCIGDLILSGKIINGSSIEFPEAIEADQDLLSLAIQAAQGGAFKFLIGNSLTVDKVITCSDEKRALSARHDALVVEMESYWVGKFATDSGIRFLAIRSISDLASENLLPFDHFYNLKGSQRWKAVWRYFRTKPEDLGVIPKLYLNSRKARNSLTSFFQAFIPKIGNFAVQ